MKEIEVKILDINVEEVRKKLLDFGAKKVFEGEVHAVHFDFPDGRLGQEEKTLRVRTIGDEVEFCFKGKNESAKFKSKEEIEVITSNFEDTMLIVEKLGLKKVFEMDKHRESYKLNDVKFEIDTYLDIPTFLEIEAPTEELVVKYVKILGYTEEQMCNLTAMDLKEKYGLKNE